LHRVGRGALAKVVAHHPEVQAPLVRGVATYPPHEHVVAPGGVDRKRVERVLRIVHHHDAGCGGEELATLLPGERRAGLHVDRLGVARVDRNPGAGGRHPEVLPAEDLARLGHHLALLGRVVVPVLERFDLGQHVERDLVRIGAGRG
jgi:hypothetical protein